MKPEKMDRKTFPGRPLRLSAIVCLTMLLICSSVCAGCSSDTDDRIDPDDYVLHTGEMFGGDTHVIGFDCMLEYDALPTGCEIVSATMLLDHYGYTCDMMELYQLIEYADLPDFDTDGPVIGADPDYVFIGDPTGSDGYTCNIRPLANAIDTYVAALGDTRFHAVDISGTDFHDLYGYIDRDIPVEILVSYSDADFGSLDRWASDMEPGKEIIGYDWVHALVLIGYDGDQAIVADPAAGIYAEDAAELEHEYIDRGRYAMVVLPTTADDA